MPLADLDGTIFQFEVSGTGESVVTIHGSHIADAFKPLLSEPALAGYTILAYHRQGYAGSSRPRGVLSVAQQAADCHGLMRHLGIPRAHVVAHSFGGAVALELAAASPEVIQSLTLLEPALTIGGSGSGYRESLEAAVRRYDEAGASVAVDRMLEARWPGYKLRLAQVMPGAFEAAVEAAPSVFEAELPGLLAWKIDEERCKQMSLPVLSVVGGESGALSPRFAEVHRWLQESLGAEAYVLPGAHHFLQIENPRDMATTLADFFRRYPIAA